MNLLLIFSIFILLFGIITQATLYPNNKLNMNLLRSIVNKAFWPIFGDMEILQEINVIDETCLTQGNCPLESGIWFSYISLMIYMVIANVLLINLLIAMFSSTYERVEENTDQIWKYQRYRLVNEYTDGRIFPPPINFIDYVVYLFIYLKKNERRLSRKDESKLHYIHTCIISFPRELSLRYDSKVHALVKLYLILSKFARIGDYFLARLP